MSEPVLRSWMDTLSGCALEVGAELTFPPLSASSSFPWDLAALGCLWKRYQHYSTVSGFLQRQELCLCPQYSICERNHPEDRGWRFQSHSSVLTSEDSGNTWQPPPCLSSWQLKWPRWKYLQMETELSVKGLMIQILLMHPCSSSVRNRSGHTAGQFDIQPKSLTKCLLLCNSHL